MLLILSNKVDIHTDIVIERLHKEAIPFIRWNVEDFPTLHQLAVETNGRNGRLTGLLVVDGRRAELDNISMVWYRRPGTPVISSEIVDETAKEFAFNETHFTLRGLWFLLSDRMWVNYPHRNQIAGNKLYQLQLAQMIGFVVPPTLITNDPKSALEFIDRYGEIAVKPIGGSFIRDNSSGSIMNIYTHRLSRSEQLDFGAVKFAPTLFQAYIRKQFELRVTVVDKDIFACAIESQATERTKDDWRRYASPHVPHRPYNLPDFISDKILRFMAELGLSFAAFDFIFTPEGEYVFLEVNPNGQWYWVEELTGLPITASLVRLFKRHTGRG
jgi:glutathione synthase/RimK-type ligase-like ATP-grasp enzyme